MAAGSLLCGGGPLVGMRGAHPVSMPDVIFVVSTIAFFAVCVLYARALEKL